MIIKWWRLGIMCGVMCPQVTVLSQISKILIIVRKDELLDTQKEIWKLEKCKKNRNN